jgi:hypothetical protein
MGATAGALLLLVSTVAYADPPAGVGAAVTESGFVCSFTVVVAPGTGDFVGFLGGYGVLTAALADNSKAVFTNSANGNESLVCTGDTAPGTAITGTDFVTGEEETGVIADLRDACDALEPMFPDVCTPGRGAAILDFESSGGFSCDLFGFPAEDWRQITTRGGRSMVSCHLKAN